MSPVLHIEEDGPPGAPAIVLLHALGTDLRLWDRQARVLARQFRVVRVDLPGHGLSEPWPAATATLAELARAVLDALPVERFHLVGASLGAWVALEAARLEPARVASLVPCVTAGTALEPEGFDALIAAVLSQGMAGASHLVPLLVRDAGGDAARKLRGMMRGCDPASYAACCVALRDAGNAAVPAMPTTVVAAGSDALVPLDAARAFAARIGAAFVVLEGAAHLPNDEDADALTDALLSHLRGDMPVAEAGLSVRRAVLGEAHVARSEAALTPLDKPFRDFILEGVWGRVWTRPGLSRKERSLITLSMLAALGHHDEYRLHVRATRNTGVSAEEIAEALLHVASYAGVPAANHALKIAKETLKEMEG